MRIGRNEGWDGIAEISPGSAVAKRPSTRSCAAASATGARAAAGAMTRNSSSARVMRLPQLDDGPAQQGHVERAVGHGDRGDDRDLESAYPPDTAIHVEQEQLAT